MVTFLTAVAFCCYRATSIKFMPGRYNAAFYDGRHVVLFLTAVDKLLLRGLYLDRCGRERSGVLDREEGVKGDASWDEDFRNGEGGSTWRALKWAALVFFSERDIGTTRQAKHIPDFSGRRVPARARFLLYRGCKIVGAVAFLGFLNTQPRLSVDVFAARKSKFLLDGRDLTMDNVIVRILSTIVWWIVMRIVLGLLYNVASFIGVGTRLTAPRDWPPYFGSLIKAYTLRNFWA